MKKTGLIIAAVVAALVIGLVYINQLNQKYVAEENRKEELQDAVCEKIEGQYFPLEGEATAIYIIDDYRLQILSLQGSVDDYLDFGTMKYKYSLVYISDTEYQFGATLDQISSTHKEDYSFRCKLTISGDDVILSDLSTEDPFPSFGTSTMLTGEQREQMLQLESDYFYEAFHKVLNENSSKSSSSSTGSTNRSNSSSSSSSKKTYNNDEIDPNDYDLDAYYEDYKDEFINEDDAADDFLDNEEYWDDY